MFINGGNGETRDLNRFKDFPYSKASRELSKKARKLPLFK